MSPFYFCKGPFKQVRLCTPNLAHVYIPALSKLLGSLFLQATPLQRLKPVLYAKCLQLLYAVAAAPLTCEPVFRLMCPPEASSVLLPALGALLLEPLTAEGAAGVHAQVRCIVFRVVKAFCVSVLGLLCPPEASGVLLPAVGALLLEPLTAEGAAGMHAQVRCMVFWVVTALHVSVLGLLCPPEASAVLLPAVGALLLEPLTAEGAARLHAQVCMLLHCTGLVSSSARQRRQVCFQCVL
jgi:hypothetical protein